MLKFLFQSFFYVMGKALTGELSCPVTGLILIVRCRDVVVSFSAGTSKRAVWMIWSFTSLSTIWKAFCSSEGRWGGLRGCSVRLVVEKVE